LRNLQATLTFVQVVNVAIFQKAPDENYCYFEYDSVCNSKRCKKQFFVLAQTRDSLQNFSPGYPAFDPWWSEVISNHDSLELDYNDSSSYNDTVIHNNIKKIREMLVKKINHYFLEMLEQVPP